MTLFCCSPSKHDGQYLLQAQGIESNHLGMLKNSGSGSNLKTHVTIHRKNRMPFAEWHVSSGLSCSMSTGWQICVAVFYPVVVRLSIPEGGGLQ